MRTSDLPPNNIYACLIFVGSNTAIIEGSHVLLLVLNAMQSNTCCESNIKTWLCFSDFLNHKLDNSRSSGFELAVKLFKVKLTGHIHQYWST